MKGTSKARSPLERERTKMRERQRRSITTNIFHGLRKHGGYRLSPRADINEVLRHLAQEAGWTVDPDGTTYRSASTRGIPCPLCVGGSGRRSAPATPSCSFLGGGGGGGECSPSRAGNNLSSNGVVATTDDTLLAIYMSGAAPHNGGGGGEGQQQLYLVRQTRVSSQSSPAGSPKSCCGNSPNYPLVVPVRVFW